MKRRKKKLKDLIRVLIKKKMEQGSRKGARIGRAAQSLLQAKTQFNTFPSRAQRKYPSGVPHK